MQARSLLARARRLLAQGTGDAVALEDAIAPLEAALAAGDAAAIAARSDALLELLYDLEDE